MNRIFLLLFMLAQFTAQSQSTALSYETEVESANSDMYKGKFFDALAHYRKSFTLGNNNQDDYYHAASCAAKINKIDDAFGLLIKSIQVGYLDQRRVSEDKDFEALRKDKRWSNVLAEFPKEQKAIELLLSKLKGTNPVSLIPFMKDGRWGYFDRATLKAVAPPVFNELNFFRGVCASLYFRDHCEINIDAQGKIMSIVCPDYNEMSVVEEVDKSFDNRPPYVSSANGFKGFNLNANHEIVSYSDIYNRHDHFFLNILGPFLIDGKYYAVAHKPDRSGVIDEKGNSLPHFDFVHKELLLSKTDNAVWFYFTDPDGKTGFINTKGEKKFVGELLSHPLTSQNIFNYNIQSSESKSGVLDLEKMEWIIKPQANRIGGVGFTTRGACGFIPEKRKDVVELYFLVEKQTPGHYEAYYVDKNMKAYKPR